ncbi:FIG110192: hypothetical protein [hydrothermal vent metagenome]|uniref:COGs COG3146 n=1 Tax=hydrothermal vent metagenome TaxID=652676 RepID=A0A3B0UFQ0_9ZZZZ
MTKTELTANIYPTTASIDAEVWNSLVPATNNVADNPFLAHEFFLALENSGSATPKTGWQPQHIIIERAGQPVALMPLFLKSHSQGEYVFDHGFAQAFERAGGQYYPKLQSAIPFTPVTAAKLLVPSGERALKEALLSTAKQLAKQFGVSSVHATFVPETEEKLASENNWLTRHDTQFHWSNNGFISFDDFLFSLSSRKRKAIRRERKQALAAGLKIEWLSGDQISESHWERFFAFYQDTGGRKWGQPYLTREFFTALGQSMAERIVLMMAHDGNEYIAGALNLLGKDTLYGRYWGCSRQVPFLHFEMCYYQAVDYAINHGLKIVEAGAQGEHKLARGYRPVKTRSVHWFADPGLSRAVADYLDEERLAVSHDQDDMARLSPFKNK